MKSILTLSTILVFFISCKNSFQNSDDKGLEGKLSTDLVNNPRSLDSNQNLHNSIGKLVFDDTIHNFGIIKEGTVVEYEFQMNNAGTKDILISDAKVSCGCTVPNYPSAPIKPGQKNSIKVSFNSSNKIGMNEKSIDVITNGDPSIYHLYIQAQVEK